MKRWKIILPSLIATTTSLPLVSLASCGQDEPIDDTTPLCFTDVKNDLRRTQVSYTIDGASLDIDIEYKLDDGEWKDWARDKPIRLQNGQKLYVRNTKNTLSRLNTHFKFVTTRGNVIGSGRVNSMINEQPLTQACFTNLFSGCKTLKRAPALPDTTLAPHCYQNMFSDCTGLTAAPELPAENLTDYCYCGMFSGCKSLKVAPKLKSKHLAPHCYEQMFEICGFTTAPKLPASQLAEACYAFMFCHCPITKAPDLSSTSLVKDCYRYMFSNCRQLVQTMVELPATDLKEGCYDHMFAYCYALKTAPELKGKLEGTDAEEKCYEKMFADCKELKIKEENITNNSEDKKLICSFLTGEDISDYVTEMFRGCVDQPGLFVGTPEPGHSYYWVE